MLACFYNSIYLKFTNRFIPVYMQNSSRDLEKKIAQITGNP